MALWLEQPRTAFAPRDTTTVLVPWGSTEQHGPHLPVGTDTILATRVAEGAAERLYDAVVAPPMTVGWSHHHFPYAGTLSLGPETLTGCVLDIVSSLYATGFRRVWVVNGHGGNRDILQTAMRIAVQRWDIRIGACSYWEPALPVLRPKWSETVPIPGHAGQFETALMLAVAPHLVATVAFPEHPHAPIWVNPWAPTRTFATFEGYTDDPRLATAERGREALSLVVTALAEAVRAAFEEPAP